MVLLNNGPKEPYVKCDQKLNRVIILRNLSKIACYVNIWKERVKIIRCNRRYQIFVCQKILLLRTQLSIMQDPYVKIIYGKNQAENVYKC